MGWEVAGSDSVEVGPWGGGTIPSGSDTVVGFSDWGSTGSDSGVAGSWGVGMIPSDVGECVGFIDQQIQMRDVEKRIAGRVELDSGDGFPDEVIL